MSTANRFDRAATPAARLVEEAQAAERAGRLGDARALYERAMNELARADGQADGAAHAAALIRWIGRTFMNEGDFEAARDCYTAASAIGEAAGDASALAHAVNLMGILEWQCGDLDTADALLNDARDMSRSASDLRLTAMVEQNLGVIANIRGEFHRALTHYQASLVACRELGDGNSLGPLLNNLGMLHTDLGHWSEAEQALDEACSLAQSRNDVNAQIMIEVNRAELWIARRDFVNARKCCDRALELAGPVENTRALAEIHKHYGTISRELGRYDTAERHLVAAARWAEGRGDRLLSAEIAREQAELYWRQHRHRQTLEYLNRSHRLFSDLRADADQAQVATRLTQLEEMFLELVRQWSVSIESKDLYTRGHSERVAGYGLALARSMGLDDQALFWFRLGALVHDLGKLVVPSEILNKKGPLTPEERAVIMRHPEAGVELLGGLEFPWDIAPMVLHHHERWNGGGYPHGLAGGAIPESARILCIADVWDALTSHRSYRPAHQPERAVEIMKSECGVTFDPAILPIFLAIVEAELAKADRAARLLTEQATTAQAEPTALPLLTG